MIMGWFYDSPFEKLRKEDAIRFLAWMRFKVQEDQLTSDQLSKVIRSDLPKLEHEINEGRRLTSRLPGEQPLPCLRFNLEPLRYRHKPAIFYGLINLIRKMFTTKLSEFGFSYVPPADAQSELGYWFRPSSAKTCGKEKMNPLVFVHGVGGAVFYYQLIERLMEKIENEDNPPIFLFDLPFVSLCMSDHIPSQIDQVVSICDTLDHTVGYDAKATFVGHSYGSIVLSWMVQNKPERVANCVFLDPVCFQIHMKDILFNFHMCRVDRERQLGKPWTNPASVQGLINLAGTEMHTNNAMLRHFSWEANALWPQELVKSGISAHVLLSENDEIVPSEKVQQLFTDYKNGIVGKLDSLLSTKTPKTFFRTEILPGAHHGEFVFDETHRERVIDSMLEMMRQSNKRSISI